MAINKNLPQPPKDERDCGECGRICTSEKDGTLFHCGLDTSPLFEGVVTEPFSMWMYRCRWCRRNDTRRSPDLRLTDEEWEFINAMEEDVVPPFVKSCTPTSREHEIIANRLVTRGLARWVSQWPRERDALYLTKSGYERMGWDARFSLEE